MSAPLELVFGHTVHGQLRVVKEGWPKETEQCNLLDYMGDFKYRLNTACDVGPKKLKESQHKMKTAMTKSPMKEYLKKLKKC